MVRDTHFHTIFLEVVQVELARWNGVRGGSPVGTLAFCGATTYHHLTADGHS